MFDLSFSNIENVSVLEQGEFKFMLVQVRPILRQNPFLLNKLISLLVITSSILISSCNESPTHMESSALNGLMILIMKV